MKRPCEVKKKLTRDYTVLRPDVEVKHWEERNSDIALFEINQEFESQRLQQQQANQWADEREKINLFGELEMRNRHFRENQATYCQEIEELRRICWEETNRARQTRIDELSMHQERKGILPTTMSQLLTQNSGFTKQHEFLGRCKKSS